MDDAIRFVPLTVEDSDKIDKVTFDFMDRVLKKNLKERMSLEEMKGHIYFAGINFDTLSKHKSGRPFPQVIQGSCDRILTPALPSVGRSSDPCATKTYFVDDVLKPRRPRFFPRIGAWLGRFLSKSPEVNSTPPVFTPAITSPPTPSEASVNRGNIHRRSRNPYFPKQSDRIEGSPPVETPNSQPTLYSEPRLPSIMREEILSRRKSVGVRRRVSVLVDDNRANEPPPIDSGRLGLAHSGPAVLDLASMVLSPVMEGEEDEAEREEERNWSSYGAGLVRSGVVRCDLSSLA